MKKQNHNILEKGIKIIWLIVFDNVLLLSSATAPTKLPPAEADLG